MAQRPWVLPQEVQAYTENQKVRDRTPERLAVDIQRAEQYVIGYTNTAFDDLEEIPGPVKTAVILVAERYASRAASGLGEYQSETHDDYSYTLADPALGVENLDLSSLLDPYLKQQPRGGITMRMRRL